MTYTEFKKLVRTQLFQKLLYNQATRQYTIKIPLKHRTITHSFVDDIEICLAGLLYAEDFNDIKLYRKASKYLAKCDMDLKLDKSIDQKWYAAKIAAVANAVIENQTKSGEIVKNRKVHSL